MGKPICSMSRRSHMSRTSRISLQEYRLTFSNFAGRKSSMIQYTYLFLVGKLRGAACAPYRHLYRSMEEEN